MIGGNVVFFVYINNTNPTIRLLPQQELTYVWDEIKSASKTQAFGNQVANSEVCFGLTGYSVVVPLFTLKAWTTIYYTQFSQKTLDESKKPPLPGSCSLNRPWSSVSPTSNLALLLSCLWRVPARLLLPLLTHFTAFSFSDWLQVLNGQIVPGKSGAWEWSA